MGRPLPSAIALLLGMTLAAAALAAPPPQAEREIDQLITALGQSGCQFQRNGSWYDATTAQAHLRQKYAWLRKRDMVASAEQFIERAGSQSSMTGKAYQVRCGGRPPEPSAAWLNARLAELRRKP
jgi:Spy/CpxP family protein refolding chaperone